MARFKDKLVNRALGHITRILGERVEYRPKKGGSKRFKAVFSNEYEQVDPDTERVISSNSAVLLVRLCDLPTDKPKKNDEVLIIRDNVLYRVVDSREDGQGGSELFLQLVKSKSKIERARSL